MPGRIVTLGGEGFPPDWIQLGYSTTPISVIRGFNRAIELRNEYNSIQPHIIDHEGDLSIIYFPKNADTSELLAAEAGFKDCTALEYIDITLPASCTNFKEMFDGCTGLKDAKITLEAGNPALNINYLFNDCISLESVDIDISGLSSLEELQYMFANCKTLKNITLSNANADSVNDIFIGCTGLLSCNVHLNKAYKAQRAFKDAGDETGSDCTFTVTLGDDSTICAYNNIFESANMKSDSVVHLDHGVYFNEAFKKANVNGYIYSTKREGAYTPDHTECFKEAFVHGRLSLIENDDHNIGNATSMFEDAYVYIGESSEMKPLNCNSMFKNAHFEPGADYGSGEYCLQVITSQAEDFTEMFAGSNIKSMNHGVVPNLNNATTLTDMFANTSITNTSFMNRFLLRLANATAYTGTKTLAHLGFTSDNYSAATIQAMSNYSTFTAAGWTIGY